MTDISNKFRRPPVEVATGTTRAGAPLARPTHRPDNRILASLPAAELGALAHHLQLVSLPAGALFRHPDAALDHVYFPHQGVMSLLATTSVGQTIEVASAGRDGAICPILSPEPHDALLTTLAHGPMRVSRIPMARLHAVLPQTAALRPALEACREALLLQLRQNLVCCGLHPVEHRLARWLLEAADRLGTEMVPATQEHVAQRLGVRRTTVTLLASKLQESGAIRWGRSRVQVLDRSRLGSMACDCYPTLRKRMRVPPPVEPPAAAGEIAS